MLAVSDLVTSLRYALGDMQGVTISDYELIEAVNNAARLLFSRMGQRFIFAARKKQVLIVDDGETSTPLPSNFNGVYKVWNVHPSVSYADTSPYRGGESEPVTRETESACEYRISGNNFYAPAGTYGIEYYYLPAKVYNLTDYLDAPDSTSPYLANIAEALLKKNAELVSQEIELCCDALAGANISHYPYIGPVEILGGRV